jgi:hypothetical protein
MSHLNDLATELAAAEDRFAQGDIESGHRALSLASTLERDAHRTVTRLRDEVDRAEIEKVYAKERAK